MITFADFCCGHGGTHEGAVKASLVPRGGFDVNEAALRFHRLNHPHSPVFNADLLSVSSGWIMKKIGAVNVLWITAPCQGISVGGKFDCNHPLNKLLIRCITLIPLLNPDAFIIENVKGISMGEMRRLYHIVISMLKEMKGYRFTDGILRAYHYGVPQDRERWICIGLKREIGIPTLPFPNVAGAESLRIKHIDPSIKFIKGGYSDGGIFHKVIHTPNDWCFTITATVNAFDENDQPLSIEQVKKFCGYRADWIHDDQSHRHAWKLFGNSVMPEMSYHISRHVVNLLNGQIAHEPLEVASI